MLFSHYWNCIDTITLLIDNSTCLKRSNNDLWPLYSRYYNHTGLEWISKRFSSVSILVSFVLLVSLFLVHVNTNLDLWVEFLLNEKGNQDEQKVSTTTTTATIANTTTTINTNSSSANANMNMNAQISPVGLTVSPGVGGNINMRQYESSCTKHWSNYK